MSIGANMRDSFPCSTMPQTTILEARRLGTISPTCNFFASAYTSSIIKSPGLVNGPPLRNFNPPLKRLNSSRLMPVIESKVPIGCTSVPVAICTWGVARTTFTTPSGITMENAIGRNCPGDEPEYRRLCPWSARRFLPAFRR